MDCEVILPSQALEASVILCCKCGAQTEANETRLCMPCLEMELDKQETVASVNSVNFCRSCERFENKPNWLRCELESKELLTLCLRRLKKDKESTLVSAAFEWTEPHSRRLKLVVGFERDYHGARVRREQVITFIVANKQCPDCTKSVTPHLWVANLQVRQRSPHKRNMLYLEQLILKNAAHANCIDIVDVPDGLDFHFAKVQHSATLAQFIRSQTCSKIHPVATQLVSHDAKSNLASNKYTQMIELCFLNKDDLVFIPKKVASSLGGLQQLALCTRVGTAVQLMDPSSLRGVDLDMEKFWKNEFHMVMTKEHLRTFLVLDISDVDIRKLNVAGIPERFFAGMKEGSTSTGPKLVDLEIARTTEIGVCDTTIFTRSHLGGSIHVGDIVCGYDLVTSNVKDTHPELDAALSKMSSEVIVVKKLNNVKKFNWVMKTLPKNAETSIPANRHRRDDIMDLKEELQQDAALRAKVSVYRDPRNAVAHSTLEDGVDEGTLKDLIDGLTLEDDYL